MLLDLRAMGDPEEIETAVCVIGAGAAGLAIAHAFAGSPSLDAVVLESGGLDEEASAAALNEADNVGLAHYGLVRGRIRGLGGTTRVWPGQCMRLSPLDFEERPWVDHSGWPIGSAHLEPFYERAERLLGISPDGAARDVWAAFGVDAPELDASTLLTDVGIFAPRPKMADLVKGTLRRGKSVHAVLHATVTALHGDDARSRVETVEARSLDGGTVKVRARAFVLAAGGIENARLMLASRWGNELTGRFFQDHPIARCALLHADRPRALQELFGVFYRGRRRYYPKLALTGSVQARERVLNCSGNVVYDFPPHSGAEAALRIARRLRGRRGPALRDIVDAVRGAGDVATMGGRLLRGRPHVSPPESISLLLVCEQAPNPDSRIMLSPKRDRLGVPRARLDWRVTDAERRTMETFARTIADEFERIGLAQIELADWLDGRSGTWMEHIHDSFHHMGSTRMAREPTGGVVDPACRVHGVANLYVAGSSVFPTSGYANPTSTIIALAIRLADHLRNELGG